MHVQSRDSTIEYNDDQVMVAAMAIHKINNMYSDKQGDSIQLVETYSLKKGLQKFGKKGHDAAHKEMKQLHDRICFRPIDPNKMSNEERKKAMES